MQYQQQLKRSIKHKKRVKLLRSIIMVVMCVFCVCGLIYVYIKGMNIYYDLIGLPDWMRAF